MEGPPGEEEGGPPTSEPSTSKARPWQGCCTYHVGGWLLLLPLGVACSLKNAPTHSPGWPLTVDPSLKFKQIYKKNVFPTLKAGNPGKELETTHATTREI